MREAPDPFGGSYYVEQLTDAIEAAAREYIERIDQMGGTLAAIEKGFIQNEIQNSAYEYQRAVEEGRQIVVGVNKFQQSEPDTLKPFKIEPQLEQQQIERLREVRTSRSQSQVQGALDELENGGARLGKSASAYFGLVPRLWDGRRNLRSPAKRVRGYRETF